MQPRLDHQIDLAGRQQTHRHSNPCRSASELHLFGRPLEIPARSSGRADLGKGGEQDGVDPAAVSPGFTKLERVPKRGPVMMRPSPARPEPFADIGLVDDARKARNPCPSGKRNQHAPGRCAADEGAGAVDRIENPGQARFCPATWPELLAQDTVLGPVLASRISRITLRSAAPVRLGHRVESRSAGLVVRRSGQDRRKRKYAQRDRRARRLPVDGQLLGCRDLSYPRGSARVSWPGSISRARPCRPGPIVKRERRVNFRPRRSGHPCQFKQAPALVLGDRIVGPHEIPDASLSPKRSPGIGSPDRLSLLVAFWSPRPSKKKLTGTSSASAMSQRREALTRFMHRFRTSESAET